MGPELLAERLGFSFDRAGLRGTILLVACAIVIDTIRHVRSLPQASNATMADETRETSDTGSEAWAEVLHTDTELESRLACAMLRDAGIEATVVANRAIAVAGTLGLWEWTTPTYPAIVIHRRLGWGSVAVCVPENQSERARALLEPFQSVGENASVA